MTVAQVLKQLSTAPPMAILKLCNRGAGDAVMESMLQHAEDLDFTQDVLTTVANRSELNPSLHAILSAFNRRRNTARFKSGQQNMDLDCIRFAHTATHNDSDVQAKNRQDRSRHSNSRRSTDISQAVCRFFQRRWGCRTPGRCRYDHKCIICGDRSHGAVSCYSRPGVGGEGRMRQSQTLSEVGNRGSISTTRANSVPPDPRRRLSRARNA